MKLNISAALKTPGEPFPFSETLDALSIDYAVKVVSPIAVSGVCFGQPGSVLIEAKAETTLELKCDRCTDSFIMPVSAEISEVFYKEPKADDDQGYEIEGNSLDLDLVTGNCIFIELPRKLLCKEDCRGLCPACGANLNHGECSC